MLRVHYASGKDSDMFYFVRKRITDPFLFLEIGAKKYIFLNSLEFNAFTENNRDPSIETLQLEPILEKARSTPGEGNLSSKLVLLVLQQRSLLSEPIAVSKSFPLNIADYIRDNGAKLIIQDPLVPERAVKNATELNSIRTSLQRTLAGFVCVEDILKNSAISGNRLIYQEQELTSELLKEKVEETFFNRGMENTEGIIISSALQTATPHHEGRGAIVPHQPIVCDFFPRDKTTGYFADMTRTYVKGNPSDQVQKMYAAVKESQAKGFELARPGIPGADLHTACADVLVQHGFDTGEKGFTHGLGHGLGLDVHERPHVSEHSRDVLEVGNVVTIEPGLYYPEWGGVRLEDVVLITESGYENLGPYPYNWIIS